MVSVKKLIEVALPLAALNAASTRPAPPLRREPDFGATRVDYRFAELLARVREPG